MAGPKRKYMVKLANSEVVGPFSRSKIKDYIKKNKITGSESVQELPDGDWQEIHEVGELAKLLVDKRGSDPLESSPLGVDGPPRADRTDPTQLQEASEEIEATQLASSDDLERWSRKPVSLDRTRIKKAMAARSSQKPSLPQVYETALPSNFSSQETLILEMPAEGLAPTQTLMNAKEEKKSNIKKLVLFALIFLLLSDLGKEDKSSSSFPMRAPITAMPPNLDDSRYSVEWSEKFYNAGIKAYTQDNVEGYEEAAKLFRQSIERNKENSRAYGMLASSYLNLIESARNETQFFETINLMLEAARTRAENLPQTVIAEVELLLLMDRYEAALLRLDRFSRMEGMSDEFNYYIALALYGSGQFAKARSFVDKIPDGQIFSPKVYYLRGKILENLGDINAAVVQYKNASELSRKLTRSQESPEGLPHAKSRLALAELIVRVEGSQGIKTQLSILKDVTERYQYISAKDLARAYFLRSQSFKVLNRYDLAVTNMTRALRLDPANLDYQLEHLFVRFKKGQEDSEKYSGQPTPEMMSKAKMYAYLIKGEEFYRKKKYADAREVYFKARREYPKSYLPFLRLGDAFYQQNKLMEAKRNYALTVERVEKTRKIAIREQKSDYSYLRTLIDIWFKYADVLIKTYEWEKAQVVIQEMKEIPGSRFPHDQLKGDLERIKGNYEAALNWYKRAMDNAIIDPSIFVSYGETLMLLRRYQDAPFYFALARKLDPLNMKAIVGTGEAISNSDSIDAGINYLEKELEKMSIRSEIVTAIAELEIRRGSVDRGRQLLEEAIKIDPKYPDPHKVKAQLFLRDAKRNPQALESAIIAFRAYSDLNPTDASGYLERFKIFLERRDYQNAEKELSEIYDRSPKYPGLHYYRGQYYSLLGDRASAIKEYGIEIANHPDNVSALLALGEEYMMNAERDRALNLFQDAARLAPTLADPWILSAKTHISDKQEEAALAMLKLAQERSPNRAEIYKLFGDCYRVLENTQKMKEFYQKYLQLAPDAPDREAIRRFL